MNGQTKVYRPYSIAEIPSIRIDYRGLVDYAHSIGKTVPELSDKEKEMFTYGVSMNTIREAQIKW